MIVNKSCPLNCVKISISMLKSCDFKDQLIHQNTRVYGVNCERLYVYEEISI